MGGGNACRIGAGLHLLLHLVLKLLLVDVALDLLLALGFGGVVGLLSGELL